MEAQMVIELISTLGFPIVACAALAWFCYYTVSKSQETHAADMATVQKRCKEREDILYSEIQENRKIISDAIGTIAKYAEKLDSIQDDIKEIKTDVTIIMANK